MRDCFHPSLLNLGSTLWYETRRSNGRPEFGDTAPLRLLLPPKKCPGPSAVDTGFARKDGQYPVIVMSPSLSLIYSPLQLQFSALGCHWQKCQLLGITTVQRPLLGTFLQFVGVFTARCALAILSK